MIKKKNSSTLLLLALTLAITSCGPSRSFRYNGYRSAGEESRSAVRGNLVPIVENPFIKTGKSATSTFSIDADGASYALTRSIIAEGRYYDYECLRTEELVNYFTYNYDEPTGDTAIAVNGEVSSCPWNKKHKLIRIGLKGKSVAKDQYPLANFVLLIDVSGSMEADGKLELLKNGFIDFVNQMRSEDRIAIVTYAGHESIALESTPGTRKGQIIEAIRKLRADGMTNGSAAIKMAYDIAQKNFIPNGNNRVIMGTDGDFNVGITSTTELVEFIQAKREKGVFLTTLGVGTGNLNDGMLEKVANKGNGNYEYLDSHDELKKVFIDDYSKFLTVAQDVKIQVTFNKNIVEEYRLIGYENRVMTNEKFQDDKADAGEIGAGQTITALYEIKPKKGVDYKKAPAFTIHFRYKKPAASTSIPIDLDIYDMGTDFNSSSENMRFAASVAALGLCLRRSDYMGRVTLSKIKKWSAGAVGFDPGGYRAKHLSLLNKIW